MTRLLNVYVAGQSYVAVKGKMTISGIFLSFLMRSAEIGHPDKKL